VKVPDTTQPGQKLRLKGLGLPGLGDKAAAGDLFVTVDVALPRSLTEASRKAWEELARVEKT
jgi:DnaJ-class molecular chaperone